MGDLMSMFEELERQTEPKSKDSILHAPFGYPGAKSRSLSQILPRLPYTDTYIEPFGGSAAVMLARHPSKLEVYNDRYGGVVAFYQCLRSETKLARLMELVEMTVHSREDFVIFHGDWENTEDPIERAFRWYYMTFYSFSSLGRNFGRATCSRGIMASIRSKLELFPLLHERFKKVQVENQDWRDCIHDYDTPEAIFYIDPPYLGSDSGIYKSKMSQEAHRELLNTVMNAQGFCAVSGYPNELYDNQEWDNRFEWESFVSLQGCAYTEGNNKKHLEGIEKRGSATEVLWIKEAK